ncbi:glycosyltransferase family 9 protein [bacterium]|nr:glycosyltransferase family 9 protein [bacterium]
MMARRDFRRILLIRRKALGDALVTLPAVLEVARAWPRARIDLVIDRPFAPLLAGLAPEVRILPWPLPAGESWLRRLRRENYDLVIDWLGNPRTALWTILSGAPVRVGYDLPRRRWAYNVKVPRNRAGGRALRGFAGEAFLDPLRALGVETLPWRDGFAAAAMDGHAAGEMRPELAAWADAWRARPGVPTAVVMSATWAAKQWPVRHVGDLLRALPGCGANPVLIAGPGDEWLVEGLGHLPVGLLAPPTTLPELAFLLSRAALFVGTDCGPRHLAAALGRPTVTIFGPTDPGGWNPPTPRHVSVRNPVPCAPCDLTECPVPGHPCLDDLDSGTVIASVERMLARLGRSPQKEIARDNP